MEHMLDKLDVEERIWRGQINDMAKIYHVRLSFTSKEYSKTYTIGVSDVMETVDRKLLRTMLVLLQKEID